jgi:hypothetical protein
VTVACSIQSPSCTHNARWRSTFTGECMHLTRSCTLSVLPLSVLKRRERYTLEQRIRFPRALATPSIHLSRSQLRAYLAHPRRCRHFSHALASHARVFVCVCVGVCVEILAGVTTRMERQDRLLAALRASPMATSKWWPRPTKSTSPLSILPLTFPARGHGISTVCPCSSCPRQTVLRGSSVTPLPPCLSHE